MQTVYVTLKQNQVCSCTQNNSCFYKIENDKRDKTDLGLDFFLSKYALYAVHTLAH